MGGAVDEGDAMNPRFEMTDLQWRAFMQRQASEYSRIAKLRGMANSEPVFAFEDTDWRFIFRGSGGGSRD